MTADVELLPLPHWLQDDAIAEVVIAGLHPEQLRNDFRACVSSATEALRAEVAEWKRVASAQAELHGEAEALAERLAEALRGAEKSLRTIADLADVELLPCAECGMPCRAGEYHPFAACLMFKACHNSETVRANLAPLQAERDALVKRIAERLAEVLRYTLQDQEGGNEGAL